MLPAGFKVMEVDSSADLVLSNLFEHYQHDMAEWFEFDTNESGAYAYPTEKVWAAGYRVFFVYQGEIPMGFALVGSGEEFVREAKVNDVDEFFVVRRCRRRGIGRAFAYYLWNEIPGDWLVRVFQPNLPAIPFWRSTISAYTRGAYSETVHRVEGKAWSYFLFRSGSPIRKI